MMKSVPALPSSSIYSTRAITGWRRNSWKVARTLSLIKRRFWTCSGVRVDVDSREGVRTAHARTTQFLLRVLRDSLDASQGIACDVLQSAVRDVVTLMFCRNSQCKSPNQLARMKLLITEGELL